MRYDISKRKAPEMPNLGKGTECIKLLLSQASKDMHEPLVPMFFPVLGAHISGAEFQYPDLTWKEMCGQMAHLVATTGATGLAWLLPFDLSSFGHDWYLFSSS